MHTEILAQGSAFNTHWLFGERAVIVQNPVTQMSHGNIGNNIGDTCIGEIGKTVPFGQSKYRWHRPIHLSTTYDTVPWFSSDHYKK